MCTSLAQPEGDSQLGGDAHDGYVPHREIGPWSDVDPKVGQILLPPPEVRSIALEECGAPRTRADQPIGSYRLELDLFGLAVVDMEGQVSGVCHVTLVEEFD